MGKQPGIDFMAGWQCFAAQNGFRQLFGVGPDCMHTVVYGSLPQAFVDRLHGIYGEMVLTNAHNEWLTMMVNQGIVGAVSFAGMLISAIRRYLSSNDDTTFICGICLIAYTANNMFSFQQLLSTPTMYILLGLAESCIRHKINKER